MNVVFLIRDLGYGGAQRQLVTLAKNLDPSSCNVTVLYFYPNGSLENDLKASGISLICLQKQSRWDFFGFFQRLVQHLKQAQPDVLHGYMDESNLLTMLLKLYFPSTKIIWGIRDSDMNVSQLDWFSWLIFHLIRFLSHFTDQIIVNSHAGKNHYQTHGFPIDKMKVIPNGIDTEQFKPDLEMKMKVRSEFGISKDTILIGLVGRLHPMKDHPTFLKAAAALCEWRQDVSFICVGTGSESYAEELHQLTHELGIAEKMIWTGARANMPAIYNALDILCSASSYGEGFANVIGEAMACGIPCVVTDVGDSAWLVGDKGVVVPPKSPERLELALENLIEAIEANGYDHHTIRKHIVDRFSVHQLASRTQTCLLSHSYA